MTREEIQTRIRGIFRDSFEIDNPGLDDDLRDMHGFDSIDGIELLREIEIMLDTELSREEKEIAMEVRTIRQILDYIELMASRRSRG
ncbi:MAG: acyl carrier protein [Thermodesulfobacteriota bacterium]